MKNIKSIYKFINRNKNNSVCWEELPAEIIDPNNPYSKFNVVNFYRPSHASIGYLIEFIAYFTQSLSTLNRKQKKLLS